MQEAKHLDEVKREQKKSINKKISPVANPIQKTESKEEVTIEEKPKAISVDELIHKQRLTIQTLMIKFVEITRFLQTLRSNVSEISGQLAYESRSSPNIMAIDPKEFDAEFVQQQIEALGPEKKMDFAIGPQKAPSK